MLFLSLPLSGQKQKPKNQSWYDDKFFHFGFSLGFNTMDFNITPNQAFFASNHIRPELTTLNPGINIQIVTNLKPAKYFDLRFLPGVSFGQRVISYYDLTKPVGSPDYLFGEQRLESSFLEFPLLLKLKGDRLNNIRPYVIGGFNFRYDLAGKKEFDSEKPVYIRLVRPDLYYEAGAGFDFYLTYFKLSIEVKMSRGFSDVLVKESVTNYEQYYNAIERMTSQIWILAFHFE